ncbi:hypothetical protein ACOMHN_033943 [Nucella lapillus]
MVCGQREYWDDDDCHCDTVGCPVPVLSMESEAEQQDRRYFNRIKKAANKQYKNEADEKIAAEKLSDFLASVEHSTDVAGRINTAGPGDETCVHMAATAHNWTIVRVLLQKGTCIEMKTFGGKGLGATTATVSSDGRKQWTLTVQYGCVYARATTATVSSDGRKQWTLTVQYGCVYARATTATVSSDGRKQWTLTVHYGCVYARATTATVSSDGRKQWTLTVQYGCVYARATTATVSSDGRKQWTLTVQYGCVYARATTATVSSDGRKQWTLTVQYGCVYARATTATVSSDGRKQWTLTVQYGCVYARATTATVSSDGRKQWTLTVQYGCVYARATTATVSSDGRKQWTLTVQYGCVYARATTATVSSDGRKQWTLTVQYGCVYARATTATVSSDGRKQWTLTVQYGCVYARATTATVSSDGRKQWTLTVQYGCVYARATTATVSSDGRKQWTLTVQYGCVYARATTATVSSDGRKQWTLTVQYGCVYARATTATVSSDGRKQWTLTVQYGCVYARATTATVSSDGRKQWTLTVQYGCVYARATTATVSSDGRKQWTLTVQYGCVYARATTATVSSDGRKQWTLTVQYGCVYARATTATVSSDGRKQWTFTVQYGCVYARATTATVSSDGRKQWTLTVQYGCVYARATTATVSSDGRKQWTLTVQYGCVYARATTATVSSDGRKQWTLTVQYGCVYARATTATVSSDGRKQWTLTVQYGCVYARATTATVSSDGRKQWTLTVQYGCVYARATTATVSSDGGLAAGFNRQKLSVLQAVVCAERMEEACQLALVDLLLQQGANLEQADESGRSIVHLAAWSQNWAVVKDLLLRGAQAQGVDVIGYSLFHRLAKADKQRFAHRGQFESGIMELAAMLVSGGVDIDGVGGAGEEVTALHLAARLRHWETVRVFIHCGADPCVPDPEFGVSLFHRVATSTELVPCAQSELVLPSSFKVNQNDLDLVRLLQEKGLDINAVDQRDMTPLDLALYHVCHVLRFRHYCARILWILVACGARFNPYKLRDSQKEFLIGNLALLPDNLLTLSQVKRVTDCVAQSYGGKGLKSFQMTVTQSFKKAVWIRRFSTALLLIQSDCGVIFTENTITFLVNIYFEGSFQPDFNLLLDGVLAKGVDVSCIFHTCEKRGACKRGKDVAVGPRLSCPSPCMGLGPLHYVIFCVESKLGRPFRDLPEVLRTLLFRGANPLVVCCSVSLLRMVLGLCRPTDSCEEELVPILRVLLEAGVSTHQQYLNHLAARLHLVRGKSCAKNVKCHHVPRPLYNSRTRNPLRMTLNCGLMKILVLSGACSNRELFLWRSDVEALPRSAVPPESRSTLAELAGNVQPLWSLARCMVSHLIGCGPRRQHFVHSKCLPETIMDLIQFQDLFWKERDTQKQE